MTSELTNDLAFALLKFKCGNDIEGVEIGPENSKIFVKNLGSGLSISRSRITESVKGIEGAGYLLKTGWNEAGQVVIALSTGEFRSICEDIQKQRQQL